MADRFDIVTPSGERITPDIATSVTHELAAELTAFPVESGLPVNDALKRQPRRCSARLLFSAYSDARGGVMVGDAGRPQLIYEQFLSLHARGDAVTIVTRREVFHNMVLVRFTSDDNADTVTSLACSVVFQELRTVSSRLIQIPPKRRTKSQRHRGRRKGAAAVTAKKPAPPASKASLTAKILAEAKRRLGLP